MKEPSKEQVSDAQDEITREMARLRKILKQSSKNELINLLLSTVMEMSDLKNALKVMLEEKRSMENGVENA